MSYTDYLPFCIKKRQVLDTDKPKYVNLAPTKRADDTRVYFEALNDAINDPDVYNIGLTGPYGSGKSSIIRSFMTKYDTKKVLNISLASFLTENKTTDNQNNKIQSTSDSVSKQEIERSILQQILYGTDANKLPFSRFKRIKTPKWYSIFISLFSATGIYTLYYLYTQKDSIFSQDYISYNGKTTYFDYNLLNIFMLIFGLIFLWKTTHYFYLKSFGVSLKSISLSDVVITPEVAEEASILNRHLDEIIYFFQSTAYDLVVIEDLDRFNNPDIFVTLREINGLINANSSIKRQIRFLYALRDDMFINTERTKFFEFIIPVIPIINHSNSIDKVLEQRQRLMLNEKINNQFLREVSRYLTDLRLIRNIFNEYIIYIENLEKDNKDVLDPNKLLAVLIYKNVLPRDFELLHQQNGIFYNVLSYCENLKLKLVDNYKSQISNLENKINLFEDQLPSDVNQLRDIYAMSLIKIYDNQYPYIIYNNERIHFTKISEHVKFDEIIQQDTIVCRNDYNSGNNITNVQKVLKEVDKNYSYEERKAILLEKNKDRLQITNKNIIKLKNKISNIHNGKINKLLLEDIETFNEMIDNSGSSKNLLKYLILEGYLDDSYYQYTSLYHKSGRLSSNDNIYLIKIRSFIAPEPDIPVDNPSAVIAEMRDTDFSQNFILNINLFDFLIENSSDYADKLQKAIHYISTNFEECQSFFNKYYISGRQIPALIMHLSTYWKDFASSAIKTENSSQHIANILAHSERHQLIDVLNSSGVITKYIDINISKILAHEILFKNNLLKELNIQIHDLESIILFNDVFTYIFENSLYEINMNNIKCIFEQKISNEQSNNLLDCNYTTILNFAPQFMINYINKNFYNYFYEILLNNEQNSNEKFDAISRVVNDTYIEFDDKKNFITMQNYRYKSINELPEKYHKIMLEFKLVDVSWSNLIDYINKETFEADTLLSYMKDSDVRNTLNNQQYSYNKSSNKISDFIYMNQGFNDDEYRGYLNIMPCYFHKFPDGALEDQKMILIDTRKVRLNEHSFKEVSNDFGLMVSLLSKNIDEYLNNKEKYQIDDAARTALLQKEINDNQKVQLIHDMSDETITNNNNVAGIIGSIFNRIQVEPQDYSSHFLGAIISNSSPVETQIALFNKFYKRLSRLEITEIIKHLPLPFSDIAIFGKTPRIPNNVANTIFAAWLKEREIISSYSTTFTKNDIKINTFKNSR